MICPFCSLRCEFRNSSSLGCGVREKSLSRLAGARSLPNSHAIESSLTSAAKALNSAKSILITGRITTVETSRSILDFARRLDADIDLTNSDEIFHYIQAVQRGGMFVGTLGECRSRSDTILFLGDDSLFERYPRLLELLDFPDRRRSRSLVFMGEWSEKTRERALAFSNSCYRKDVPIIDIPQRLMTALASASDQPSSKSLVDLGNNSVTSEPHQSIESSAVQLRSFKSNISTDNQSYAEQDVALKRLLEGSSYVTIVWSPHLIDAPQTDLWFERLYQFIFQVNVRQRCVGLPVVGNTSTFQQVCTWTTGFPGRIRFRNGDAAYFPEERFSSLGDYDLIIEIDESAVDSGEPASKSFPRDGGDAESSNTLRVHVERNVEATRILLSRFLTVDEPHRHWLPIRLGGVDCEAVMFRFDGSVALKVVPNDDSSFASVQAPSMYRTPAEWLAILGGIDS